MAARTPMTEQEEHTASREGHVFRSVIGIIVLLTAISGFAGLFFYKVPGENKDAFIFALGSVFGWAASVVASEYGATTTGRKVAESAIRNIERQDTASASAPAGTPGDPFSVAGADPDQKPVETKIKP